MAEEILMPELGESVHEGTVSRWLKNIGDSVKEDEPVVEIMTDKVNTELQAPSAGILIKILIPEGENVKVFEPLGLIGTAAEMGTDAPVSVPTVATKQQEVSVQTSVPVREKASDLKTSSPSNGRRWYTPVVRSMARANNLSDNDMAAIAGTGEGGRVTKRDVQMYLSRRTGATVVAQSASTTPVAEPKPVHPSVAGPEQEIVPLTGMRKAIADAMVKAHTIPSVSTITAVDVSKLVEFRRINKDSFQSNYGVKLTYTPFFIKATVEALQQFPVINGAVTEDGKLLINHSVHMGIAVALGDGSQGLIVPVIRDAHKKNLIELAKDLEEIAARARDNKLDLASVQGATSTITNPGTYGALFGTPMIPPGQASILGTYAIQETPVASNGMIGIKPIMHLVLSYDHRIIDGMLAGKYLKAIKDKLEAFDFFR